MPKHSPNKQTGNYIMRSTAGLDLVVIWMVLSSLWPATCNVLSWNIFPSSSKRTGHKGAAATMPQLEGATVADFSIDGANDPRGVKLPKDARRRIAGPTNCWNEAYRSLFASCADIMADKERQSRLAWLLSSCFQEDSGRPLLSPCDERSKMVHCRKRLTDSEGKIFLEIDTLSHQLQAEVFKHRTERLVNDPLRSAKSAHEKLEVIEERVEADHARIRQAPRLAVVYRNAGRVPNQGVKTSDPGSATW